MKKRACISIIATLFLLWIPTPSHAGIRIAWSFDDAFTTTVGTSEWIVTGTSYTVLNLTHGRIYFYRAHRLGPFGLVGPWSNVVSSTQDALAPKTTATALAEYHTTSTFYVDYVGTDTVSGLAEVTLFYSLNDGPWLPYGRRLFNSGPFLVRTTHIGGDGFYRFATSGKDYVENIEVLSGADTATTVVTAEPEPPVLLPMPTFTSGTEKVIFWEPGP